MLQSFLQGSAHTPDKEQIHITRQLDERQGESK